MRKYRKDNLEQERLEEISCNKCGEIIAKGKDCSKVDSVTIHKTWGYFSNKDNETHSIDLCEKCYDEWIKTFVIPPTVKKNTEYI